MFMNSWSHLLPLTQILFEKVTIDMDFQIYIHPIQNKKNKYMRKFLGIFIMMILVIGCSHEPVFTVTEKKEQIGSPIAFLVFMMILVAFSLRAPKPKKKVKH